MPAFIKHRPLDRIKTVALFALLLAPMVIARF
jgi:hypothetical protein